MKYAKLKKVIAILTTFFSFSSLSYSATPGFYLGAGVGYGSLQNYDDTSKKNDGGVGGAIFAGYNLSKFIGLEVGYRKYPSTTYQVVDDFYYDGMTIDYNLYVISGVVKAYLPLSDSSPIDFYGLLGVAQAYGQADFVYDSFNLGSASTNTLVAMVGLGLIYKISSHFSAALEWSGTTNKNAEANSIGIPQSNLLTVNMIYNVG